MDLFNFQPDPKPETTPRPRRETDGVMTVAQLTRKVRELLERGIGAVTVRGEISNLRRQSSGHQYFTLKDADAQLPCVLFRGASAASAATLRDGMQVQAFGDITVYEARGQYQMIVRNIQEAGAGMLQAKFEALKRKLLEEGLFDPERKKPVPRYPKVVAIVTSPTGAALRDMLHILQRRSPWIHILVFPVRVQGEGAHLEIADAIRLLSRPTPGLPEIDTVVVGRGGGSLEDLWSFNEESVARAIAECPIPVISAVGHEIDFTITDFVADLRAPTPSAAAELLAPDRAELRGRLEQMGLVLANRIRQTIEHGRRVLDLLGRGSLQRAPQRWLAERRQSLDVLRESVLASVTDQLRRRSSELELLRHRLDSRRPDIHLQQQRARVAMAAERLVSRARAELERLAQRMHRTAKLLQSLGPAATLARGFSFTAKSDGRPVLSPDEVMAGEEIHTTLSGGRLVSVARKD